MNKQISYTLNVWWFYDTVIDMCFICSIVNFCVYMYIRLSVSVTCFLLFEAFVEDWHVKRVASWNKVFNILYYYIAKQCNPHIAKWTVKFGLTRIHVHTICDYYYCYCCCYCYCCYYSGYFEGWTINVSYIYRIRMIMTSSKHFKHWNQCVILSQAVQKSIISIINLIKHSPVLRASYYITN